MSGLLYNPIGNSTNSHLPSGNTIAHRTNKPGSTWCDNNPYSPPSGKLAEAQHFAKPLKSLTLGSIPGQGWLKVESVAVYNVTGMCVGG
eukprot:5369385-Ditylum_brightwellii.AAC.1